MAADHEITLFTGDGEQESTYYILSTGMLFVEDGFNLETQITRFKILYGEKTFYRLQKYNVTFETGGEARYAAVETEDGNAKALVLPEEPVKEGYTFGGWFTSQGDTAKPGEIIHQSVTYHAKWTKDLAESPTGGGGDNSALLIGIGIVAGCAVLAVLLKRKKG